VKTEILTWVVFVVFKIKIVMKYNHQKNKMKFFGLILYSWLSLPFPSPSTL
jgi:hypothetical protein